MCKDGKCRYSGGQHGDPCVVDFGGEDCADNVCKFLVGESQGLGVVDANKHWLESIIGRFL